ncbi:hypothetical protein VTJ04DRAFT_9602 [Mycothermus thermophilus]|uniref:uncharacterized protein n=1 Tax=Humicola insolens TaxID=85995 RepID=UPI0037441A0A
MHLRHALIATVDQQPDRWDVLLEMGDTRVPPSDSPEIPNPYQEGVSLPLQVFQQSADLDTPLPDVINAEVLKVLGMSQSPVLLVQLMWPGSEDHQKMNAVLKLYDRRFGSGRRDVLNKHRVLTKEDEDAFQSFVRSDQMKSFLDHWRKRKNDRDHFVCPWFVLDDDDDADEESEEEDEPEDKASIVGKTKDDVKRNMANETNTEDGKAELGNVKTTNIEVSETGGNHSSTRHGQTGDDDAKGKGKEIDEKAIRIAADEENVQSSKLKDGPAEIHEATPDNIIKGHTKRPVAANDHATMDTKDTENKPPVAGDVVLVALNDVVSLTMIVLILVLTLTLSDAGRCIIFGLSLVILFVHDSATNSMPSTTIHGLVSEIKSDQGDILNIEVKDIKDANPINDDSKHSANPDTVKNDNDDVRGDHDETNDDAPGETPEERNTRKRAEYEAALWEETDEDFHREIQAYDLLRDLQGRSIPRLLAHVGLDLSKKIVKFPGTPKDGNDATFQGITVPEDLRESPYFQVRGFLLEHIEGCNLSELALATAHPSCPAPQDSDSWASLLQEAVDVVYEINKRGFYLTDCQPRNIVARQGDYKPFMVDLARYQLKDEVHLEDDDDDFDLEHFAKTGEYKAVEKKEFKMPETEEEIQKLRELQFWRGLRSGENTEEISSIIKMKVKREKGIEIKPLQHPDYDKIIQALEDGVEAPWDEKATR